MASPKLLEAFAGLSAAEAKPARSISLLAAASAFRENTQTPLPPGWRPDLERRLRPAKMALSPLAWDAAWEAGLRMSADGAMDYALGTD